MNSAPTADAIPGYLAGTWKADPTSSEVAFGIRQLVGTAHGRFTGFDVTIRTSEEPLSSSVAATIDLASIDTGNQRRDNHLRSAAILGVEKYPTMTYRSTGIRQTDDGWVIDGELTLREVTRQVPVSVEVKGFGPDAHGRLRARFSATARVSRRDFGMTIPMGGGGVIGDRVAVRLEIDAVRRQ